MLKVFKINPEAILPTRSKQFDAGVDLYSIESVFIPVGQTRVVKTGIAIDVPMHHVGKIEDRSSLAAKGLRTGGGVIDHGYSGEVGVVLHNFSANPERDTVLYQDGYRVKKGDRVAQLLVYGVELSEVKEVYKLWESERKDGAFGSTGR